jgi:hypothetical protein
MEKIKRDKITQLVNGEPGHDNKFAPEKRIKPNWSMLWESKYWR